MIEHEACVKSKYGLHARPSRAIYLAAVTYEHTNITLIDPETKHEHDAKSILDVMCMGKICGDLVIVRTSGEEEAEAATKIAEIIETFEIEDEK